MEFRIVQITKAWQNWTEQHSEMLVQCIQVITAKLSEGILGLNSF